MRHRPKSGSAPKRRAKVRKKSNSYVQFSLNFGLPKHHELKPGTARERKALQRASEVSFPWPKKTRALAAKTINRVLSAIREQPHKKEEIMRLLMSTIKPGFTYYKPLGAEEDQKGHTT